MRGGWIRSGWSLVGERFVYAYILRPPMFPLHPIRHFTTLIGRVKSACPVLSHVR
jgi:hypothetical protein